MALKKNRKYVPKSLEQLSTEVVKSKRPFWGQCYKTFFVCHLRIFVPS
jgi:hypothetical protein